MVPWVSCRLSTAGAKSGHEKARFDPQPSRRYHNRRSARRAGAESRLELALGFEWTVKNSILTGSATSPAPPLTRVLGTRPGGVGQWLLETTGRDHAQDGPVQGSAQ